MSICPCTSDKPCWRCDAAERLVRLLDSIFGGDERGADLWYWTQVRWERWRQQCIIDHEALRRAALVPKYGHPSGGREGPGQIGEGNAVGYHAMGKDADGTDRDIDANGWYSNVRREYEECR